MMSTLLTAGQEYTTTFDAVNHQIADYVYGETFDSAITRKTCHYAFWDALSCCFLAAGYPACRQLLGPSFGHNNTGIVRVPGTTYQLDPVRAAFNIGTLIRWLDYNDTWLAKEWGHPSDNLGAILACADYLASTKPSLTMRTIFQAQIKAYEIQGCLACCNAFNVLGIDHVLLVKLASAAVAMQLLGGTHQQCLRVLSQVWLDGHPLRTYRHAPNTGTRKSWAAGDATSRAIWLCELTLRGEMGYPTALSQPQWGFERCVMNDKKIDLSIRLQDEVIRNILFKVRYPAEFHAQTAVECACRLHKTIVSCLDDIASITIETQRPGIDIISKTGPLHNPADRDHCMQYMVAVALLYGDLKAEYYEDGFAANPSIDRLRHKMTVLECAQFTRDYYAPEKRSIANRISISFKSNQKTLTEIIEYPIGHQQRRKAVWVELEAKVHNSIQARFANHQADTLIAYFNNSHNFEQLSVRQFISETVPLSG